MTIKIKAHEKTIYAIGTRYKTKGKFPYEREVIDILTTYNSDNLIYKIRYVTRPVEPRLGSALIDRDVLGTTIAMGLIK